MKKNHPKVGIVGGGLAGIYTAYLLTQHNITYDIIEAKAIFGGRIYGENTQSDDYKIDLGPSWIFPHQQAIQKLVTRLGLQLVEQYNSGDALFQRSANQQPEPFSGVAPPVMYRIFGGTSRLIDLLSENIDEQNIRLSTTANSLQYDGQYWHIKMQTSKSQCGLLEKDKSTATPEELTISSAFFEHLVIAVPPRVIAHKLSFEHHESTTGSSTQVPDIFHEKAVIQQAFLQVLNNKFEQVPTWMAAQAKFAVTYSKPFWRKSGLSGQAFSHVGPMGEIHDASFEDDSGNSVFALFGFIGIPFAHRQQVSIEQMKNACLSQLASIFGLKANEYQQTYYKDWASDIFTANSVDQTQAPMHPHIDLASEQPHLQQIKLHLATSEFSEREAGYMEGAILAATNAVEEILLTVP
jgi:monoamine oxidase